VRRFDSQRAGDAVIGGAFGGTLANPELERTVREQVTVAMIAAAGAAERQLLRTCVRHFDLALHLRNSSPSASTSVYAGFPRALNALHTLEGVLAEAGIAQPPIPNLCVCARGARPCGRA
jgi:3-oxoadipate enol-lactonase